MSDLLDLSAVEARAALDRVEAHRPIQQSAAPSDPDRGGGAEDAEFNF